jgi:transposase-like protein
MDSKGSEIIKSAERYDRHLKSMKLCKDCNSNNVQIIDWMQDSARWKCRICQFKWTTTLTNKVKNNK